jgi:hypothetical protein
MRPAWRSIGTYRGGELFRATTGAGVPAGRKLLGRLVVIGIPCAEAAVGAVRLVLAQR